MQQNDTNSLTYGSENLDAMWRILNPGMIREIEFMRHILKNGFRYTEDLGQSRIALQRIRTTIEKQNATPEKFGTSEDELQMFERALAEADKKWTLNFYKDGLESARKGWGMYYSQIFCREKLLADLLKHGFTLKDLGTTSEELDKLKISMCKIKILDELARLRKGSIYWENCLRNLRKALKEGNLTLVDTGSSEEEIDSLTPKGLRKMLLRFIKWLYERKYYVKATVTFSSQGNVAVKK